MCIRSVHELNQDVELMISITIDLAHTQARSLMVPAIFLQKFLENTLIS